MILLVKGRPLGSQGVKMAQCILNRCKDLFKRKYWGGGGLGALYKKRGYPYILCYKMEVASLFNT